MNAEDVRIVRPCRRIGGAVRAPGDKSISHRAAMLGALAEGASVIEGFLPSEDCLNTLKALAALGAVVTREGGSVTVVGTGGRFREPAGPLDLGNSGTGIRLLAGLLAGQPFSAELTGDASLRSRPMRRIQEPLERMGAQVQLLGPNGGAPIRIRGGRLAGIDYTLPVASAQVKSCVLLAGLFAKGTTTVVEPRPTRDHTERMLAALGAPIECQGRRIALRGAGPGWLRLPAGRWTVPADFSSAAFWMTAAAAREGAEAALEEVGLNPRRTALLDVLRRMGADVRVEPRATAGAGEPLGRVTVRGGRLRGTDVGGDEIPNLIDELPLVAVAGALAEGRTTIRDAAELRVKESDRILAMCRLLRAFGVEAQERPDGLEVRGGRRLRGGVEVDSLGDHRVAMCAAVLALFADAPVRIRQVACIATSYPSFWADLERLTESAGA